MPEGTWFLIALLAIAFLFAGFVVGHREGFRLGEQLGKLEGELGCIADKLERGHTQGQE